MRVWDYYKDILVPANSAVTKMQLAGLPISEERGKAKMEEWQKLLLEMEKYVEDKAAEKGIALKYSAKHAPQRKPLIDLLYSSSKGLGLECVKYSQKTQTPSADDEALLPYAGIGPIKHRKDDNPVVYTILKIRSVSKARGTHLAGLLNWRQADGCAHPSYKWILLNTTRLSAENPAVHQLPERADPEMAEGVKSIIVPRVKPWLGNPDDWNPKKHGWIGKCDVKGAEAVIRAGCIAKCRTSVPYLRTGGDIHSKTASIMYRVEEGIYKKGTLQRDTVGKQSYFLLIFGGSSFALQYTLWKDARIWIEEIDNLYDGFFEGYPDLKTRYLVDSALMFERGYIEDFYGRRWHLAPPDGTTMTRDEHGEPQFHLPYGLNREDWKREHRILENRRHKYANRPTQSAQATTTLWCIALCIHGEYVELRVPEYFEERGGLLFPEAKLWQLNGGRGPGGKPFQAWANNTVHDSLWLDGAPGYLEPAAKLLTRRFNGVPADFLIENNMPWRAEITAGPDLATQYDYNVLAERFGLEPLPKR